MSEYIDILLTQDGVFCIAPPWEVKEGDWVCLPDALGGNKLREVISVATDAIGGEHAKLIEKYIGYPLPRITAKYRKSEVEWNAVDNDR